MIRTLRDVLDGVFLVAILASPALVGVWVAAWLVTL